MKPAFSLGKVVSTPRAWDFLNSAPVDIAILLARHQSGDCCDEGGLSADDILANLDAILSGEGRIFSSYDIGSQRIWVITEADRSVTTVMLPEDY